MLMLLFLWRVDKKRKRHMIFITYIRHGSVDSKRLNLDLQIGNYQALPANKHHAQAATTREIAKP